VPQELRNALRGKIRALMSLIYEAVCSEDFEVNRQ
jgi:hypothetical protein